MTWMYSCLFGTHITSPYINDFFFNKGLPYIDKTITLFIIEATLQPELYSIRFYFCYCTTVRHSFSFLCQLLSIITRRHTFYSNCIIKIVCNVVLNNICKIIC